MLLALAITAMLGAEATDGGSTLDAGPDLFGPVIATLASRLANCAAAVDGGEALVSIDFEVKGDGVEWIRQLNEPSKVGRCVEVFASGWHFPPAVQGYRAQTFLIGSDGGVEVRDFTGRGGLDKKVILPVIKSHQSDVRDCYSRQLVATPGLTGQVWAKWVIGPNGTVIEANIERETMPTPAVGLCVVARVKTWQFPRPIGGGTVNVTFPWIFVLPDAGVEGLQ